MPEYPTIFCKGCEGGYWDGEKCTDDDPRYPDDICRYSHNAPKPCQSCSEAQRVIEFLEGTTFRLIKTATGYIFIRPGNKPDFTGATIVGVVQKAIDYEGIQEENDCG